MTCRCEVKQEGQELKIVADCRSCKEGRATLEDGHCLSNILKNWSTGFGADSIILSGTIETQYSDEAVLVISQLSDLLFELDGLARRRGRSDKRCGKCLLSPSKLFHDLSGKLKKDIGEFYLSFRSMAIKIADARFNEQQCASCLKTTKDDVAFVYDRFEDFVKYVIKEGFSIVL